MSKKREKYKFGNFDCYYGERNLERWNDSRIAFMRKEWFYQKKVLDIGSNDGTFTILIACAFDPASILGLEIDSRLVNRAVENIVFVERTREIILKNQEKIKALEELEKFPLSFRSYLRMPNYVESLRPFVGFEKTLAAQADFPRNVSFQVVNALEASWSADTVLFLSTSKWVHLNWGDSGLKSLFLQIYQSLSPGGLFIFEPQDWKSYKKSKFKLKELSKNFDEIQFKPESFDIYLKTLGFLPISSSLCENDKKNFTRSIFIYSKPVN